MGSVLATVVSPLLGALTRLAQVNPIEPGSIDTPSVDWTALIPHLVLMGGGVVALTLSSVVGRWLPNWFWAAWTAAVGTGALGGAIWQWFRVQDEPSGGFSTLDGAVGVDGFSVYLTGLISATVVLTAILAYDYTKRRGVAQLELYVLLLLSASGGVVMAGANDLIVMFLGLEVLSIAVYVLAALDLRRFRSQEAGMKYFVLGAFSSAFFLYGIALIYGAAGSTNLLDIDRFLSTNQLLDDGLLLGGFALLLVGLLFKVGAVPFHAWTPDVYQGAPSPIVAYMASGVKVAGFAAMLRIFWLTFGDYRTDWQPIIYAIAAITLLVGSIVAVVQTDVKRMLAYSSISHAGYILVGVQAATADGTSAALFYLGAYSFMVIGSFAVVTVMGSDGESAQSLGDYSGLARRRPVLALTFTLFLFAQAGVPFTSGFFAKFYVISAAVEARSYWLAAMAMMAAVIAAVLYLRIVLAMYIGTGDDSADVPTGAVRIAPGAAFVLFCTAAMTITFGIIPFPIVDLARDAVPVLVAAG
jgi:NADH-quinone oxidoreductase subunit N